MKREARGSRLPPALRRIWPEVAAALPPRWRDGLKQARPCGAAPRAARVWKLEFDDGTTAALKLAAPDAPLDGEAQTLAWLHRHGCAVPQVLAALPDHPLHWLMLSWCGDQTLDDALQGASPARRGAIGRRLATAQAGIEAAFMPMTRLARQAAGWGAQVAALHEQCAPWLEAMPAALAWLLDRPPDNPTMDITKGSDRAAPGTWFQDVAGALHETVALALAGQPDAGCLDYNPRNVVLARRALYIVDFPAVGVDFPERRLVQYGTATGAGTPAGAFETAIVPSAVAAYAEAVAPLRNLPPETIQRSVDAHDVLLLLTAAVQLQMLAAGQGHRTRRRAWKDIARRRGQLLALLRRRLVRAGPAEALRAHIRRQLASDYVRARTSSSGPEPDCSPPDWRSPI